MIKSKLTTAITAVACSLISSSAFAVDPAGEGNRYDLTRMYESEISGSKAFLLTNYDRGNKSNDPLANAVILDVRRIVEYRDGHPPGAYSAPFPHINGSPDANDDDDGYIGYNICPGGTAGDPDQDVQDAACFSASGNDGVLNVDDYVAYVESIVPNKNTPILTLCRTGYRSVQAANILTQAGYTVYNIWEGYRGQYKTDTGDNTPLDLNGNDVADDGDYDGWANFLGLPTSTKLKPKLIFSGEYEYLYYE
jgi:rhodanese-related sulfurtransferase